MTDPWDDTGRSQAGFVMTATGLRVPVAAPTSARGGWPALPAAAAGAARAAALRAAGAVAPYRGVGPKGYRRSDPHLHEQVCERLLLDPYLDASGIVVKVAKGKVALSGTVPTERMKSAAVAAAASVAAGAVDCQVRVTAAAAAGPSRMRVRRAFLRRRPVRDAERAGSVSPSPEVDDESSREGGDDCQRHGLAAGARGRCRRRRARPRADASLQSGRERLWLRQSLSDRRPARRPGHLVLLDRRQREVLGEDGGAHRGQRQPARVRGLAAARPPVLHARRDHPAGMPRRNGARPVRVVDGSVRAARRPRRPRRPDRHRRPPPLSQSEVRQGQLERRELHQASREDGAAVPHRHGVRVLPRRLQPAEPARERRGAEVVEPRRRDRQSVLGRRPALQPAHAGDRLPVARRQPAAARDVGHVTLRDRPHQQSERDQPGLQPRVPADRAREDGGRHDAAGAPHPQGWRRLDWRRRRVAARLREHRHVLGLLADAARPGERAQAAAAVPASRTRGRTARTGATRKRGWRTPRRFSRRSRRCT